MKFNEKLDFLMDITRTTNSALGHRVKLDPSYISRLRRGQRNAVKDEGILGSMAEYFARNFASDYQLKALAEKLEKEADLSDEGVRSLCISKWLADEKSEDIRAVGGFLDSLNSMGSGFSVAPSQGKAGQMDPEKDIPHDDISVYTGPEGKRRAAEIFLKEVIEQYNPRTLLLYSDEATDWMTQDQQFSGRWADLMKQVLGKGNRVRIIHTVSRDLDEMLRAIHQWMPLYMTGLIEPYYYPRKRDGLFKQTLFVAPGVSAVISSSVGSSAESAPNLLVRRKDIIASYEIQFNQYLAQCRPLMQILMDRERDNHLEMLTEFESHNSNSLIRSESLSFLTMPEVIFEKISERSGTPDSVLARYRSQRTNIFEENLRSCFFGEIIPEFSPEYVSAGKVKVSFSDMMYGHPVYYTAEEYIQHLENLLHLMDKYENFHVKLVDGISDINYMLYIKENHGAIISKTSAPYVVLYVNETNMTAAFWDFLSDMSGSSGYTDFDRSEESERLRRYIDRIKKAASY